MSSDTNNLTKILTRLAEATRTHGIIYYEGDKAVVKSGESDDEIDEAIAAVLALLPEEKNEICGLCARIPIDFGGKEIPIDKRIGYKCRHADGFNSAIDQTRRNLIGENAPKKEGTL